MRPKLVYIGEQINQVNASRTYNVRRGYNKVIQFSTHQPILATCGVAELERYYRIQGIRTFQSFNEKKKRIDNEKKCSGI
jgi:hypothetical protein